MKREESRSVNQVDRALRRAMLILRGFAAISEHRAAERSIHLINRDRFAT
jgi:hypothetical protein